MFGKIHSSNAVGFIPLNADLVKKRLSAVEAVWNRDDVAYGIGPQGWMESSRKENAR